MATIALAVTGLTKRFGTRAAVRGLSFTAAEGDILGLLGPNGAGKTTTVRLLSTVLTPSGGSFSVAGVSCADPAEIRRRIGVLPESSGYPGNQSGFDYLRYHARLFGYSRPAAARRAEALLGQVGLADRASARIATYSRGMRQRLGIARAMVNNPAVVLLDEPTLGLDPAGQRQVLSLIRDLATRSGATVVVSTHTLPEVEQMCTHVLIMDHGAVVASGGVGEVAGAVARRRFGLLRVPAGRAEAAMAALAGVPGLRLDTAIEWQGELRLSTDIASGAPDGGMGAALRVVLAAGIPVLRFESDGGRLSEAFHALTGKEER